MRLKCEVALQNWSATQGLVSRRKPSHASISIGRKHGRDPAMSGEDGSNGTVFLLLCTSNNMSGTKYKIFGNIENIFGRFVREGKATIRFKQPTHELCLSKVDPSSLHKFLTTLKSLTKDCKNVKLPVLSTVKRSEVQKTKTDLMISSRNEYLKSAGSFPVGLKKLSLVNCNLIRFDVRVLALRQLVELNLSQNKLKELDFSLEQLRCLRSLNLSSNQLTLLPSKICRTTKLVTLDLSHNKLSCLPVAFGTMKSLVNVKLSHNNLRSLPSNVGQLSNLRSLNVSNNQLVALPMLFKMGSFYLDTLDISCNTFLSEAERSIKRHNLLCDTLQERAGKVIKKSRIFYDPYIVGKHLCDFLDSGKLCCRCHNWCFGCIHVIADAYHSDIRTLVRAHQVTLTGHFVPLEHYFCSSFCDKNGSK